MTDFTTTSIRFVLGSTVKGNVNEALRLIKNINDQINSETDVDKDYSDRLYDDIQKVIEDLVLIYGCQEIEKKI
jgi:hypothetical protein